MDKDKDQGCFSSNSNPFKFKLKLLNPIHKGHWESGRETYFCMRNLHENSKFAWRINGHGDEVRKGF